MINPIFKNPTAVLFSFTPSVVDTIKQTEHTVWEVATDIFNNVQETIIKQDLPIEDLMLRPEITTIINSFTIEGDNITNVGLKTTQPVIANINPYIGLSLGILASYEKG